VHILCGFCLVVNSLFTVFEDVMDLPISAGQQVDTKVNSVDSHGSSSLLCVMKAMV